MVAVPSNIQPPPASSSLSSPTTTSLQWIEVVGGNGRIGSQFMRLLSSDSSSSSCCIDDNQSNSNNININKVIAVPKGICPGSFSTSNSPIYICTPSTEWYNIVETTIGLSSSSSSSLSLSSRISDLVFIGNGLLPSNIFIDYESDDINNNEGDSCSCYNDDDDDDDDNNDDIDVDIATTIVVPHYGILNVGDVPTSSLSSPPTYIAGKYSHTVQTLLHQDSINNIQICTSYTTIIQHIIQKIIWTSCLWLLCHTASTTTTTTIDVPHSLSVPVSLSSSSSSSSSSLIQAQPITVAQVHEHHSSLLLALVVELWPSIQYIYNQEMIQVINRMNNKRKNRRHQKQQQQQSKLPNTIGINDNNNRISETFTFPYTIEETITYMEQYSMSIPNAIPNKNLAIQEISVRNQIFASVALIAAAAATTTTEATEVDSSKSSTIKQHPKQVQPIHYQLLEQVFGTDNTNRLFQSKDNQNQYHDSKDRDTADVSIQIQKQSQQQQQRPKKTIIDLRSTIGLALVGEQQQQQQEKQNPLSSSPSPVQSTRKIVVIGAGILGSSVAMNLARLQSIQQEEHLNKMDITVFDASNMQTKIMDPICTKDTVITTTASTASFGWINANYMKQPNHYQNLNAMGIHVWKNDPLLQSLPNWTGSIVCMKQPIPSKVIATTCGYYNQPIGPLSDTELHLLEPNISTTLGNDTNESYFYYYFPNEGHVDPVDAIHRMQAVASDNNVSFIHNHAVTRIIPYSANIDHNDRNVGALYRVEYHQNDCSNGHNFPSKSIDAHVVIIAAGAGSAHINIGLDNRSSGLPMQQETNCRGCITQLQLNNCTYNDLDDCNSTNGTLHGDNETISTISLQRILVDMVNETHVLQRRNGTIVVGGDGGSIRVGGTTKNAIPSTYTTTNILSLIDNDDKTKNVDMVDRAANLLPELLQSKIPFIKQQYEAVRPIPLDGLPSVGFYSNIFTNEEQHEVSPKSGIYSLVSHSGITLAPLLGALAAAEILYNNHLSFDILKPYRPQRLYYNTNNMSAIHN